MMLTSLIFSLVMKLTVFKYQLKKERWNSVLCKKVLKLHAF